MNNIFSNSSRAVHQYHSPLEADANATTSPTSCTSQQKIEAHSSFPGPRKYKKFKFLEDQTKNLYLSGFFFFSMEKRGFV